MILNIRLTEQDVRDGKKCLSRYCPIAIAVNRALMYEHEYGLSAAVGPDQISLMTSDERLIYRGHLPEVARAFVAAFDICDPDLPPKPIYFSIEFIHQ